MNAGVRTGLLAFFGLALIAAAEPPVVELVPAPPLQLEPEVPSDEPAKPDYPEPPAFIAERINRGKFDQGEFEYLRGYFPGASKEDRARHAQLVAWLDQCWKQGEENLAAVMAEFDVTLLEDEYSGVGSMCQQVAYEKEWIERFESYAELSKAARGARIAYDALMQGVENATFNVAPLFYRKLFDEIDYYALPKYIVLRAANWGETEFYNPDRRPQLTEDERVVFSALIKSEFYRLQFAQTQWLEEVVARHGWPTEAKVDRVAASNARLLVAFGDHDPGFQLRMLRLMEAEVAKGELDGFEFAEIHSEVMLKLTGKQRYGTHTQCNADGTIELMPLEDPDKVNEWRATLGLEPLTESGEDAYYEC